jgi:predicted phage terminase large subunit-like protein
VSSDEVGGHVSLFVGDDCQSVENSNTPETLETLIYKNALLKALVDPKCYRQYLGTPLLPGDLYQHLRDTVPNLKVLFQPALTKKESSAAKEDADCTEADYVLHFPERLSWDFLESTRKEQPEVYRSQYLLDPRGEGVVTFGFDTLVHATVPPESLPDQLSYVSICDMAYSLSDKADRTCICTIGVDNQGRAFVVDIRHSRFTPQEIAEQIVDVWLTFHPVQVVIEASNGSGIMEVIIRNIARDRGIENIRLNFFKVDVKRGAKARRVGCLQPLLLRGQLFFSSAIECLTELYEQFQRFGYTQHDDLPDCVSLAFASGAVSMREAAPDPRVEAALRKDADYRVFHDLLFPQEPPIQPELIFGGEEGTGTDLDDIYAVPGIPQNYPAGARR